MSNQIPVITFDMLELQRLRFAGSYTKLNDYRLRFSDYYAPRYADSEDSVIEWQRENDRKLWNAFLKRSDEAVRKVVTGNA